MLMTRSDIVALKDLSSARELVPFDSIPAIFKDDFQMYIFFQIYYNNAKVYFFLQDRGNNRRKSDRGIVAQSFDFALSS